QPLLDRLNLRHEEGDAGGGPPRLLAQRNVVHVTLRGPLWGEGTGTAGPGPVTTMLDLIDGLVASIMAALIEQFRELTYDRLRLTAWLAEVAQPGDRAEAVVRAAPLRHALAEA